MLLIRPVEVTDTMLINTSALENEYTEWDSTATYLTGDRVQYTVSGNHMIYESLVDANTNFNPTYSANVTKWIEVFATNKWRMFDQTVSTQSRGNGELTVSLIPQTGIDAIVFMNVEALTIQVTMTDPAAGLVYDETINLVSDSGIDDWYSYFFEPLVHKIDVAFSGLPTFPNATIDVVLNNGGDNALCGACIIGKSLTVGYTQYGANVGIVDYSVINADDWGNYNIVERAFSKRADFDVMIENRFVDYLHQTLALYRATPCVYIGADDYSSTIIYGIFKDFQITLAEPGYSRLQLSVEGLT